MRIKKANLWWIIPLSLVIGWFIGSLFFSAERVHMEERYPIIACLRNVDTQLNNQLLVYGNKMPINEEIRYLERKCAEKYIDFDYTGQS